MRINFYEARLSEDDRIILVKDKAVNYKAEKLNAPDKIAKMMRELLHMGKMAEEYCYMIALSSACRILGIFFHLITDHSVNEGMNNIQFENEEYMGRQKEIDGQTEQLENLGMTTERHLAVGKGICQNKNGRYEARYIDRFGNRRSIYGTSKVEVRNKLQLVLK